MEEECERDGGLRTCPGFGTSKSGARVPKPVVDMHIDTVALAIRSNASRQASAGGHFSVRPPRTVVAARMV